MILSTRTILAAMASLVLASALASAPARAGADHPNAKRTFDLPPSADLAYSINAKKSGMSLSGEAQINWRAGDGKYSIATETRAVLFGKILEHKSEGAIDSYGLAPARFYEKRFRKEPDTTVFNRDSKHITFSDGALSYPLKGGEQDRTSAQWQLAAVARANPGKFKPGSEWSFFVAGRRDAEPWVFKVVNLEPVRTPMGEVSSVHLVKMPPPDSKGQQVDLWLAPSLEWYPVRLRFADEDGEFVEQTLEKITKK
jgi:hypothetical protein